MPTLFFIIYYALKFIRLILSKNFGKNEQTNICPYYKKEIHKIKKNII